MYLRIGTYILLISLLGAEKTMAFQGGDPDIAWYEEFFKQKNAQPVEQDLNVLSNRLQQASERHDMPTVVRSLNEIGLIHLSRTHLYDQAVDVLIRALTIEDSLNLNHDKIFTYMAMAQVFEEVGDFYKSAELLEEALALNEQSKNVNILVFLLTELGKVHASMGRLDEAFENYEQVLDYRNELGQGPAEAEALFNLAHLYQLQGKYDDALKDYKKALVLWRSMKDKKSEALSLNDIGELYRLMKNNDKSMANHLAALEIRERLKDKKGLAESYNEIAVLYFQSKHIDEAIKNLNLALSAAQEAQDQNQLQKSYEYLSECYRYREDYQKALYYKNLFLEINDFIQNEKNEQNMVEAQTRYVIDHKELQIEKLVAAGRQHEKELADELKFRKVLIALIALSFVVVALILYLYVVKRKSNLVLQRAHERVQQQNVELQDLNATKDKFFSIISHDLKGPLNSLTSFSGLLINHTDSLSKEDIQRLAKDLDKSLKNLFALLENLLEWSRSQTGNIEFTPEDFDLGALLLNNLELLKVQAQNKSISLSWAKPKKILAYAHPNSINTVVRNLISNAIKFTPAGGSVIVDVKENGREVITSITDTGVGMSPEVLQRLFRIDTKHTTKGTANEKGTGLGLILCKEFIEKNSGRLWVESEEGKGSVFYFSLPIK